MYNPLFDFFLKYRPIKVARYISEKNIFCGSPTPIPFSADLILYVNLVAKGLLSAYLKNMHKVFKPIKIIRQI
jgi:hypothetical protein